MINYLHNASHDNCLPAFGALNTVLSNTTQKLNAFKVGQHSSVDFYTWLETHPVQQGAFHRFMEAQFASLPTWLDAVDFGSEMRAGLFSPEQVAFVDVGGGNGQQIAALKAKIPDLQGRLVLQDRPVVLEKALEVEGMEKMSYDYLTEQPVKSACVSLSEFVPFPLCLFSHPTGFCLFIFLLKCV